MVKSVVRNLTRERSDVRFFLLSPYPTEDAQANTAAQMTVVSFSPWQLMLLVLPLVIIQGLLRVLRLPWKFLSFHPAQRCLIESQLVVDVSGISFVDGRGVTLVYNVLLLLIPMLIGKPVFKCSQAMGPFRGRFNRVLSKWLLPKVAAIAARGRSTEENLKQLDLINVTRCADLAFCLPHADQSATNLSGPLVARDSNRQTLGISVSSVVHAYCLRKGIDYPKIIAEFVDQMIETRQMRCVIFAHSARPGCPSGRTNDIPICRQTQALVRNQQHSDLIEDDLNCDELRLLISSFDYFVASRFHAMISALTCHVPTLVLGWSHKYLEVLEDFELSRFAVDYSHLTTAGLSRAFEELVNSADDFQRKTRAYLPRVQANSFQNIETVRSLLARGVAT